MHVDDDEQEEQIPKQILLVEKILNRFLEINYLILSIKDKVHALI